MFSVYILECADGSYYAGMTENLERRLSQHDQAWFINSSTSSRLPVKLERIPEWHPICRRTLSVAFSVTFHNGALRRARPTSDINQECALVWHAEFSSHDDAFRRERQIKGWSRAKKQALIRDDFEGIQRVVALEHLWRGNAPSKSSDAS